MRKIWDFHGGIHPAENKCLSNGTPIANAGVPPILILPLSQHIGAPAKPVVEVGDTVLKGQLIAEADGFVSVPVHASSSGRVIAVEDREIPHPSGLSAPCIVIETDGEDRWLDHSGHADFRQLEADDLLAAIRDAGIAGMGGAGFPTAVKVAGAAKTPIKTLIVNGTECEPYITADDCLMREQANDIVAGAEILRHLAEAEEVLIGIEDNKPEAIAALQQAAEGHTMEVVVFPTKYPSGGEKQLIEILTGKQVPSGGLPADIGIVCQNVGTCVAVHRAVSHGEPLISRITTLTGQAMQQAKNMEVLLGTPVRYLLQQGDYQPPQKARIIMGGPMMGFALPSADVPVIKTTNCILTPTADELPLTERAQACIRCALCAEVCPASLLPQQLYWFAQGKEHEKLEQHNLFDCIECGACSWVCPSHIPLVQYYRASKAEVIKLRQDNKKSEYSRERFEAREARLERLEAEKEAKRAARKKAAEEKARLAAASGGTTTDPIKAAIERAQAKKAAQSQTRTTVNQQEKLESAVTSTRKRLTTAQTKLHEAEADNSDLVDALRTGVEKTQAKLEKAEQDLAAYLQTQTHASEKSGAEPAQDSANTAAAMAIEKALAARAASDSHTPRQKAEQNLDKLEQRLDKSRQRLTEEQEAGGEDKIIQALVATIQRLEQKLDTARSELAELEDS